jgi:hypothetical protein
MKGSVKHREGGPLPGAAENGPRLETATVFDISSRKRLNRSSDFLKCEIRKMALFESSVPRKKRIGHEKDYYIADG